MAPKVGYLLPTREAVMEGRPDAQPLLALAEQAEALGYDSVWIGDSVLARPRHEPLTMLAAVAGRTQHVQLGTAVLLPVLRNPVLLAHQAATLDQASNGRLILGIGIASRRGEIVGANAAEISVLRMGSSGAEDSHQDKAKQVLYWANRHVQTS